MSLPKLKSRDANGEYIFPKEQLDNLIAEVAVKKVVDKTATFIPGGVDQSGYVSHAKFTGGVETNATHDFYTKMAFTECYDFNDFFSRYCCNDSGGKKEMEVIADYICNYPPMRVMGIDDKGKEVLIGYHPQRTYPRKQEVENIAAHGAGV